jgi:prephenate dehydrogenase
VAVIGLGLIGTSLALALRQQPRSPTVLGLDVDPERVQRATRVGAIDRPASSLAEACRGSDTIVLAAPIRAILQLLGEIAGDVERETLVTDTGSTKEEIVRLAGSVLPPSAAFVGGHPLAGPLGSGRVEPDAALFSRAIYCLCPALEAPPWGVERATELVELVGAQPYFVDPMEHDALLAAVSHLPYFASVALIRAVASQSAWPEMSSMAAGGFRAISSLVDASPEMWADIAATNRNNLARQLDELIRVLGELKGKVAAADESLLADLSHARTQRRAWLESRGETVTQPAPARPARRFSLFRR